MRLTRNWFCFSGRHCLTQSLMADYMLDTLTPDFAGGWDLTWPCPSPLLWLGFITPSLQGPSQVLPHLISRVFPSCSCAPLSPVLCRSIICSFSAHAAGRCLGKIASPWQIVPLHFYEPFSLLRGSHCHSVVFLNLWSTFSLSFSGCP